jgi:hypothetical protein
LPEAAPKAHQQRLCRYRRLDIVNRRQTTELAGKQYGRITRSRPANQQQPRKANKPCRLPPRLSGHKTPCTILTRDRSQTHNSMSDQSATSHQPPVSNKCCTTTNLPTYHSLPPAHATRPVKPRTCTRSGRNLGASPRSHSTLNRRSLPFRPCGLLPWLVGWLHATQSNPTQPSPAHEKVGPSCGCNPKSYRVNHIERDSAHGTARGCC